MLVKRDIQNFNPEMGWEDTWEWYDDGVVEGSIEHITSVLAAGGEYHHRGPSGEEEWMILPNEQRQPTLWDLKGTAPSEVKSLVRAATPQDIHYFTTPDSSGGSDLSNILSGLAFIGGGYGLGAAGLLPGATAGTAAAATSIPTWAQPMAGAVADTGFGAGTVATTAGTAEATGLGLSEILSSPVAKALSLGGSAASLADVLSDSNYPDMNYVDTSFDYPDMNYAGDGGGNTNSGLMTRPGDIVYDTNGYPIDTGGYNESGFMSQPTFLDGLSSLANGVTGLAPGTGSSSYQFPWGDAIGSLVGAYGANEASENLSDAIRYAADKADPFASQRPQYQAMLPGALTDYNSMLQSQQSGFDQMFNANQVMNTNMQSADWWNNDSLLAGLNDNAVNDTSRKMASQGYNMSGNTLHEVASRLQNNNATYVPNFMNAEANKQNVNYNAYNTNASNQIKGAYDNMNMLGGWAGAGFGPGAAGTISAQGAIADTGLQNQLYGNLGTGFQSVISGSQPTMAQQLQGTQPNQTLSDVFKGWSL